MKIREAKLSTKRDVYATFKENVLIMQIFTEESYNKNFLKNIYSIDFKTNGVSIQKQISAVELKYIGSIALDSTLVYLAEDIAQSCNVEHFGDDTLLIITDNKGITIAISIDDKKTSYHCHIEVLYQENTLIDFQAEISKKNDIEEHIDDSGECLKKEEI